MARKRLIQQAHGPRPGESTVYATAGGRDSRLTIAGRVPEDVNREIDRMMRQNSSKSFS
jgi:hypothetical protein